MRRGKLLEPVLALLVVAVLLSGCGGGSKAQAPLSGSPTPKTSASSDWTRVVVYGGVLESPRYATGYVDVNVTGGAVRFAVLGNKLSAFRCKLVSLPQLDTVPIRVTLKTINVQDPSFKSCDVRSSRPLTPGVYQLQYSGTGVFQMSAYVLGAN